MPVGLRDQAHEHPRTTLEWQPCSWEKQCWVMQTFSEVVPTIF